MCFMSSSPVYREGHASLSMLKSMFSPVGLVWLPFSRTLTEVHIFHGLVQQSHEVWLIGPNPAAFSFPQRLKAAGAYAFATSGGTATGGGDFCRHNFLHGPTMDRSLQLRRQLSRLVDLRFGTEPGWKDCDVAGALRPPSRRQSDALRQVC